MSETAAITELLERYADALYEGDVDKMRQVFHPNAHLYSATDGEFVDLPLVGYLDVVAGRPSPKSKSEPNTGRIITIDQSGPVSALAKVEASVKPKDFVDYLTLLKVDGQWKIISKTYHFTLDE